MSIKCCVYRCIYAKRHEGKLCSVLLIIQGPKLDEIVEKGYQMTGMVHCKKWNVDLTLKRSSQLQSGIHPGPGGGPPPFARV